MNYGDIEPSHDAQPEVSEPKKEDNSSGGALIIGAILGMCAPVLGAVLCGSVLVASCCAEKPKSS